MELVLEPIGIAHSPFTERSVAPRQSAAASGVYGTIVLRSDQNLADAVSDLKLWSHIWVLAWFHQNETRWRPKVLPPRSTSSRGVLATRAPYRPNPIGLSACRLLSVEGLTLHVEGLDLLDGTPVLDIKPYVPYTDSVADANHGWLDHEANRLAQPNPMDPLDRYQLIFGQHAREQLDYLRTFHQIDLAAKLTERLRLGPEPHAYRRIKRVGSGFRIAVGEWRAWYQLDGHTVLVHAVGTGYRLRELERAELRVHRAFADRFGYPGRTLQESAFPSLKSRNC